MPSPFPGVDPFIEDQHFWPDFHHSFMTYWRDQLLEVLPQNYDVRLAERVVQVEDLREAYIKVTHRPDQTLVAILELLSPTNKTGTGYKSYVSRRTELQLQQVSLLEVDLLIVGNRLPMSQSLPPADHYAIVSRSDHRPKADVYAWALRDPMPSIPIPLRPPNRDIMADLGKLFALTYDRGRYDRVLNYSRPLELPLNPDTLRWVTTFAKTRKP